MNEFILKEKHKYWDNKITLEEYIKSTKESGYIDCNKNLDYEFTYIIDNLEKLNNLQSKIDKAIEILNDGLKQLDERNRCEVYSEEYLENARDILKEDNNEN